jgi:hypothetical protein
LLFLGAAEVQRLKMLCRQLNHQLDRALDVPAVEQP